MPAYSCTSTYIVYVCASTSAMIVSRECICNSVMGTVCVLYCSDCVVCVQANGRGSGQG